ncbi:hypothetical protein EDB86DRAFT_2833872 [Lactarius hatsudake]|nr:hypothetical protein EDB86DRAFT_2833872 [Lactarius hatsudake]
MTLNIRTTVQLRLLASGLRLSLPPLDPWPSSSAVSAQISAPTIATGIATQPVSTTTSHCLARNCPLHTPTAVLPSAACSMTLPPRVSTNWCLLRPHQPQYHAPWHATRIYCKEHVSPHRVRYSGLILGNPKVTTNGLRPWLPLRPRPPRYHREASQADLTLRDPALSRRPQTGWWPLMAWSPRRTHNNANDSATAGRTDTGRKRWQRKLHWCRVTTTTMGRQCDENGTTTITTTATMGAGAIEILYWVILLAPCLSSQARRCIEPLGSTVEGAKQFVLVTASAKRMGVNAIWDIELDLNSPSPESAPVRGDAPSRRLCEEQESPLWGICQVVVGWERMGREIEQYLDSFDCTSSGDDTRARELNLCIRSNAPHLVKRDQFW